MKCHVQDRPGEPAVAVGRGQGETGAEDTGGGRPAERPDAGRRVREDDERVAGGSGRRPGRRRQQGQRVRPVPDAEPAEEDAGRVLQLDRVRPVLLRAGPVHGRDRRQHIRERRVVRAHRTARRVPVHLPDGEVRPPEHATVRQPGHGRGVHTHHVPAAEYALGSLHSAFATRRQKTVFVVTARDFLETVHGDLENI